MSNKSSDAAIVVVSIFALLISSISTYINFFYNKNELSIAFTSVSVKPDSTFQINLAWINSGNKSIAISDISLVLSNEKGTTSYSTNDFSSIDAIYLEEGQITKNSLEVKHIFKSLKDDEKKYLSLKASLITSGGTYGGKNINLGKISFDDSKFKLNGRLGQIVSDFKTGSTSSNSSGSRIERIEL